MFLIILKHNLKQWNLKKYIIFLLTHVIGLFKTLEFKKYISGGGGGGVSPGGYCPGGYWNGGILSWGDIVRGDIVRGILSGGILS